MNPKLEAQMESWNGHVGDRLDPVAVALRRLYLRASLCPCMQRPQCVQCKIDFESIETAWLATNPPNAKDPITGRV